MSQATMQHADGRVRRSAPRAVRRAARIQERCRESPAASVGFPARSLASAGGDGRMRNAADDHQIVGQRRERAEQAIEDRPAVDEQRALVASAEARRPAAGEDRGAARIILINRRSLPS